MSVENKKEEHEPKDWRMKGRDTLGFLSEHGKSITVNADMNEPLLQTRTP